MEVQPVTGDDESDLEEMRRRVRDAVWAAAPEPDGSDTASDVRRMRDEDTRVSDANSERRRTESAGEGAAERLLRLLGLQ